MTSPADPYGWQAYAWEAIERHGPDLRPLAGLVALRLAMHCGARGEAWPSARTLGRDLGRTDRPIREALARLVELGVIEPVGKRGQVIVWRFPTADSGSAAQPEGLRTDTADR